MADIEKIRASGEKARADAKRVARKARTIDDAILASLAHLEAALWEATAEICERLDALSPRPVDEGNERSEGND